MSLISEFRRRNVFRVTIAYLALAWLLIEVADTLFPAFGIPGWAFRFVVIVLILGIAPTLFFSWAYEITSEGVKRERDIVRSESITHVTAKRLDKITIGLVVTAIVFVLADRLWLGIDSPAISEPAATAGETGAVPDPVTTQYPRNSIAVLPFANMSDDPANEYFSDGMSEELLNSLAQLPGLRVTSRSSAFYFKDKSVPVTEIARQLKVAHILEGSVRRAGDRVRITAQLIDTSSDAHLWSSTFDRELDDIFLVQQEIADAISDALELRLVTTAGNGANLPTHGTASPEAFDLYLRALEVRRKGGYSNTQEAARLLERAVRLDHNFALAHAELASTFLQMQEGFGYGGRLSYEEVLRRLMPHLVRAEELDPNLYRAHLIRSDLAFNQADRELVIRHARRALAVNPNGIGAMNLLAIALQDLDRYEEMLDVYRQMLETDPLSVLARGNYADWLCELGRIDEGREMARGILPQNLKRGYRKLGEIAFRYDGHIAEAIAWFLKAHAESPEDTLVNVRLVDALISLGQYDEARRIDDLMIPRIDLEEGRFDAAIAAAQTKMQRDPQNPAAVLAAANALYQGGHFDEALPLYERLRDFVPEGFPIAGGYTANMRLAVARRHAGDEPGAEEAVRITRKSFTAYRRAFGKSPAVARTDALLAAFEGDADGVVNALKTAIRAGHRDATLLAEPIFEPWWDDKEFIVIQRELDELLSQEHDEFLQLACFENPVPNVWRPLPETCEGGIQESSL